MKYWFFWWILWWLVLSVFWLKTFLGGEYFEYAIAQPMSQKLPVLQHIVKPVESAAGISPGSSAESRDNLQSLSFGKYQEITDVLLQEYIDADEIDFVQMQDNALKWFVDAVGDPYTSYLDVKENTAFDEAIQGTQNFEWIGAVVTKKKDWVMIEEVLKNSPAFRGGVQALDLILRIGEDSVQDLDLYDAVQKIRGPKGSEVILTIYRESSEEILELTVTRDTIDVPSVTAEIFEIDNKNILYLELATFGEDTTIKMKEAINQYGSVAEWVILDLRGNGGGILPISVEVASFFVPKGEVITTVDYSIFPNEESRSKGYGDLEWLPVVVLVDVMSASASEIVAGALQDQIDAVLVGNTTFGKWSVQTIKELSDGSSLKYSIGKRYTPNGTNIDEDGITPDIEVEFEMELFLSDEVDTQLERAKEEIVKIKRS